MIGYLILLSLSLGIISSRHSLMSTRTSQGTIAWVISRNTFPDIAVPAYWILGRSRFQGCVKAHPESNRNVEKYAQRIERELAPYRIPEIDKQPGGPSPSLSVT